MGKIRHYRSSLNPSDFTDQELSGPISSILKKLKIEKESLCVTINGETPDDCDLNYFVKSDDVIEIRSIVHGEGSSAQKSSLATIVQLAALIFVAASPAGWGALALAAVSVGGAIISGALNKRAMELALAEAGNLDKGDIDVSSNNYSLANSQNSARQLETMPIPMGSHRYSPDILSEAFRSFYGGDNAFGPGDRIVGTFYPGVTSGNGAANSPTNWATMPAGFIGSVGPVGSFPPYDIKINPYHFGNPSTPITADENLAIITAIKDRYLDIGNPTMNGYDVGETFAPIIIYHHSISDTLYQRYNSWYLYLRIARMAVNIATWQSEMRDLYSGDGSGYGLQWVAGTPFGSNKDAITVQSGKFYPSSIVSSDNGTQVATKLGAWLMDINNNNVSSAKTASYPTEVQNTVYQLTSVIQESIPYTSQAFNFGIGDLEISERMVGGNSANEGSISPSYPSPEHPIYSPIDRSNWQIPDTGLDGGGWVNFVTNVFASESKSLSNPYYPDTPIGLSDDGQYNWTYYTGKPGLSKFSFTISGRVYSTNTSSGFGSNTTKVEMHYRRASQSVWLPVQDGILYISNENTKLISAQIELTDFYADMEDDYFQIRVRKMSLDSSDNIESGGNSKVADISITDVRFYRAWNYDSINDTFIRRAPMNIDGLFVSAASSDAAQTNKYSALVESKCWVYDFDAETWSWAHTRNPAFWFLFFARGGFLNLEADGSFTAPYSPTYGWVNYPGHPDSTEHIFGVGLTDDRIDIEKIIEWASFCEEKELNIDMVLYDDISCSDALERIANCGRGSVSYYGGILSVVIEDPEQIPNCLFGMGNILAGSFSVDYSVGDPVAKVIGRYTDREDWESKTVEADVPFADADNIKVIEITLEGITDTSRAQREVNILAARQFYQRRTYTWSVDFEGLLAKRGDLVYLSHDSTQYGFSGRIMRFILESGSVVAIETGSIINDVIGYITIRSPNGTLNTYLCHIAGSRIVFDEPYDISESAYYESETEININSAYPFSNPEDFVFIAGAMDTPGKLVRISQISSGDDLSFSITAVDEDPAMWAYEYEDFEPSESFDDAEVVLSVKNVGVTLLNEGRVKLNWENDSGDFIQIINQDNGLPVQANGSYSFSGGEVILELVSGQKYTLELKPFSVGTPFESISEVVEVWPR